MKGFDQTIAWFQGRQDSANGQDGCLQNRFSYTMELSVAIGRQEAKQNTQPKFLDSSPHRQKYKVISSLFVVILYANF